MNLQTTIYKLSIIALLVLSLNFCNRYTIKGPLLNDKASFQSCDVIKKYYINEVAINDLIYSENLKELLANEIKSSINRILRPCFKTENKIEKATIPVKLSVDSFHIQETERYLFYLYIFMPPLDYFLRNSLEYLYIVNISVSYTSPESKKVISKNFKFRETRLAGVFDLNKPDGDNVFAVIRLNMTNFILNSIMESL